MVTYHCTECKDLPGYSPCTLTYDIEVYFSPKKCPFGYGFGGLDSAKWEKIE